VRTAAGRGGAALIKVGLNLTEDHADYASIRTRLIETYILLDDKNTTFFDGMQTVLDHLDKQRKPWGIVTNKPEALTFPLVKKLGLETRAHCVVCSDTVGQLKPDPTMILHACDLLQKDPSDCLYIGDTLVDLTAARAAGTGIITALYGYIASDEDPYTWEADGYIEQPIDLIEWV
jgi:phosphoglycolate phosphatase